MRALILILCACVTLAGCAAPPAGMQAKAAGGMTAFATLSEWGTWEFELAPAYTRLAAARHNAARLLDARRIDVATAVAVQALADQARALLDASRRGDAKHPTAEQRLQLDRARALIAEAESLLGRT